MSNTIQHKLLSIELPPPAAVWDKIDAEMNDAELQYRYPTELYELSVAPPTGIWQKISATLDMPAPSIAEKLISLEIAPPLAAWDNIKASLNAENEAAIPDHRRLSPFVKYAAAAAVVGLMAWAGISLLSNKQQPDTVAKQLPPISPIKTDTPVSPAEAAVTNDNTTDNNAVAAITDNDEARNDAALEASKKTFARLDINPSSKIKEAANFYFGQMASSGTTRGLNIGTENQDIIPSYKKDADRYIVLMTPDGNIIRMSKKLGNMICCVSGEEQDEDCKDQMKKWREKMASSSAGHSPGNLMDMLGLLNSLQDEDKF